ncbi:solute carrier family 12 member 2 [Willisornis vidua]|uniref:Solute carrier family 12 member 2 n=1 Tax=Willisornis vidua TaxID=1566151 RepID=A0ABQ9DTN5_9PASS|nr:solute carrier family 12 member 2 [Willisornis vidua]
MGPDGILLGVLRELGEGLTKPLSIIYQQSWLTEEEPDDWKLAIVTPHPQEKPEGRPGKLQTCQSDLSAWQGYGADHPECDHTASTRTDEGSDAAHMDLEVADPA